MSTAGIPGALCRSVFGEDALVNVSVEKQSDGKLAGFIRIRSKTQVRSAQQSDIAMKRSQVSSCR